MFGRYARVVQGAVLAGLCIYVIRLYAQDTINLYIHPRYSIFALVMAVVGLGLLAIWLVMALRKRGFAAPKKPAWPTVVVDMLVLVILVLAFALPAKPLSSRAVDRKSANIPGSTQQRANATLGDCSPETPVSLQEWVVYIDAFPDPDCYKDNIVTVTGFVYHSPEQPLPAGYAYVARVVISCCVVDARPYALPMQTTEPLAKDSWVRVQGKLEEQTIAGTPRLVLVPSSIQPTEPPTDIYGY